jgi:hypothetical protein
MIPAASAAVLPPTAGEQVVVRFENEPEALFTVVLAEGGGLAVVATSGASDELVYGFDPSEDEWRYPRGEVQRGGIPASHSKLFRVPLQAACGKTASGRNRVPSKKNAMEDKMQGGAASFSNEAERTRVLQEVAAVAQQPAAEGRIVSPPNAAISDAPAPICHQGERCSKKGNGGKWQCKNTAMIDRKLCARCTETVQRRATVARAKGGKRPRRENPESRRASLVSPAGPEYAPDEHLKLAPTALAKRKPTQWVPGREERCAKFARDWRCKGAAVPGRSRCARCLGTDFDRKKKAAAPRAVTTWVAADDHARAGRPPTLEVTREIAVPNAAAARPARRRLSASSHLPPAPAREVAAAEDDLLADFGGAAAVLLLLAGD